MLKIALVVREACCAAELVIREHSAREIVSESACAPLRDEAVRSPASQVKPGGPDRSVDSSPQAFHPNQVNGSVSTLEGGLSAIMLQAPPTLLVGTGESDTDAAF